MDDPFGDLIPANGTEATRSGAAADPFADLMPKAPAPEAAKDEGWGSTLYNAVETTGDAIGAGATAAVRRVPGLAGNIVQGLGRLYEGSGDFLARNAGSFSSEEDIAADTPIKKATDAVGNWLKSFDPGTAKQITTLDDFWNAPLRNAIPFALEQGIASAPDMVASLAAFPAYLAGRTNEIAETRAQNNGKAASETTFGDMVKALPAAAASALLEKIGAKGVFGLDDAVGALTSRVAKAGLKEGLTEGGQEGVEYAGENLGTDAGFDPKMAGKRMVAGAVAGGLFGAGVRAGTAGLDQPRIEERRDQAQRGETIIGEVDPGEQAATSPIPTPQAGPVPVPADRERLASPRLTESDRASPIPNDLVDDGKAMIELATKPEPVIQRRFRISDPGAPNDGLEVEVVREGANMAEVRDASGNTLQVGKGLLQEVPSAEAAQPAGVDPGMDNARAARNAKLQSAIQEALGRTGAVETPALTRAEEAPAAGQPAREPYTVERFYQELSAAMGAKADAAGAASPEVSEAAQPEAGPQSPTALDIAAQDAATSPQNDLPEPSQAQKEAGNYRKAHVRLGGMDISIENPQGSTRRGTDPDGREWSREMKSHYGYIKGTVGKDKDHIDVFVRPGTEDLADDAPVFVVDQVEPGSGKLDEHKVMVGFSSPAEAEAAYRENYDDDWQGMGAITPTTLGEFKAWTKGGDTSKPFGPTKVRNAAPVAVSTDASGTPASWVIRNKETGEVVAETFERKTVDALNTAKYEAVPIAEHLAGLNRKPADAASNPEAKIIEPAEVGSTPVQSGARTVSRPDGEAFEIADGDLPESGVVVANVHADGKAVIGKPGEAHFAAAERGAGRGEITFTGFVNPKGELLDRKEAFAWVEKSEGKVRPSESMKGELDALDYREQRAGLKKPSGIARRDLDEDTAVTSAGREVPVRYAVVEAGDLVPSQTDEGRSNPSYPAEMQPRDRSRGTSQAQVQSIAGALNPRLLDKGPKASDGAPIIAPDGVVESGNGRTLAIRRAYADGKAEAYRAYLAEKGYPVDGMKAPVLVRVRQGEMAPDERQAFTREANERDTLAMSSTEQAMADAAAMPASVLDLYRGGDLDAAQNRDFVRAFVRDVVGQNERARFTAEDGAVSQEGLRRLQGAMLGRAYGDADLVASLTESADTNIKAIGGSLLDVSPGWASMREEAKAGSISADVDKTDRLLEAVRLVERARREGRKVVEFVDQLDVFSGKAVHPVAEGFLRLFFNNDRNWTKPAGRESITVALGYYVAEARKTSAGVDMFGEKAPGADKLLGAAKEKQRVPDQQQSGFAFGSPAPQPPGRSAGAPGGEPEGNGQGRQAPEREAGARSGDEAQGEVAPAEPPKQAALKEKLKAKREKAEPKKKVAAEPAPKPEEPPAPVDDGKIEDFGQKLEGARKDQVTAFRDSLDGEPDYEAEPLSKIFPQPDYEKLAEAGADARTLATIAVIRAEIPAKPRKGYKVKRWADDVRVMRQFARDLLDARFTPDAVLQKMDTTRSLSGLRNTIDVLADLPPAMLAKAAGWRIRAGSYSQWLGERFNPPKTFYTVVNAESRVVHENGKTVFSASREEIIEKARALITAALGGEKGAAPTKRTPISVYQDRRSKTLFIGFKGRQAVIRLKTGFENVKEARAYIADNADALQATIDAMRAGPQMRREVNRPREGVDRREGDVSPEQFQEAFGFRGVQFGNYVEADRRQFELNEAFDGLMDLAETLGIPPRAISLNGTLGLAFGARGRGGAAKAHYEPGHVAINLTKSKGAGSLAHEWFHGLDHYFAKQDAGKPVAAFMSERKRDAGETRAEVFAAWKGVEAALKGGAYSSRMAELDAARSKDYWNTMIEKAARGFERYVVDRIEAGGGSNDYLANIDENAGAYPNAEEMKGGITGAFDQLFQAIDTRETEAGTELYQRGEDGAPALTLSEEEVAEARAIIDRVAPGRFETRESIPVRGNSFGAAEWGETESFNATGRYSPEADVITLALDAPAGVGSRVVYHEAFHRIEERFATAKELRVLAAEEEHLRAIVEANTSYWVNGMMPGEIRAEAFSIFARNRDAGKRTESFPIPVRAIFGRLEKMVRAVGNWLRGNGYQTWEDVFERAAGGEMAARGPQRDARGRFSASDDVYRRDEPDTAESRQKAMQGFFAKGQPIDRAFRIPFAFFGGFNAEGQLRLGRFLWDSAAHIITGAKVSPEGRFGFMSGPIEAARMGLIDRYGLDADYVKRDRQRGLDERKIMMDGIEVLKTLAASNMGSAEAKVLQDILTGGTVTDADMAKVAAPIRQAIDELGQEAVGLGLLSPESYARNRGAYLHRVYLKHEADQDKLTRFVSSLISTRRRKIIGDQLKGRGLFIDVDAARINANMAETVKQAREDAKAERLRERLEELANYRKVAEATIKAFRDESQAQMTRRMDTSEAARARGATQDDLPGVDLPTRNLRPSSYQKGQAREQGVALNRLRDRAERARAALSKIEEEAANATREVERLEASRVVVGKSMPVKGSKFRIMDKVSQVKGKDRVVRRVFLPTNQSIPKEFEGYTDKGVWEVRGGKGNKVTIWRDYTKAERSSMGEILDARYTIGKTYMLMAHDLATGRFYQDIASNPEWATADEPPENTWREPKFADRASGTGDYQWIKVPDTAIEKSGGKKKWGALSGKFVRAEIWRDLNELEVMNRATFWRTVLAQWKLNKTVRNPVVHVNNVMSNLIFMDMADVRFQDLAAGIRSFAKGDKDYLEARDNGAFGSDLVAQEMRDKYLGPVLEELRNTVEAGPKGKLSLLTDLATAVGKLDQAAQKAYQVEDEVFRMAMYLRRRQLGDTAADAALKANQQFLDYDIRAPWVNAARRTVLPFLAYTYRAAPVIAQAIATRPWKLAKYFTIAYAANALAYAFDDDDEEERERASLRDEEQGKAWIGVPRMLRMPWRNDDGLPVFMDIRRWIPAGDIMDTNSGSAALPIPAPLQFGGPLLTAFEILLNKQAFTGEEITNSLTDDWMDQVSKTGDYLWKAYMPAAVYVPGSWYWEKIRLAATGATDSAGRDYSVPEAVASSFGIKVHGQDVDQNFKWKFLDLKKVQDELKTQLRAVARRRARNMISQEDFEAEQAAILGKIDRLGEKAAEISKAAQKK